MRRSQCSNHLKQFGIAVHNFNLQHNGLPPASTGSGSATIWMLLLPFIEQQSLYDRYLQSETPNPIFDYSPTPHRGFNVFPGLAWWTTELSEQERKNFASVSIFLCPTRRGGTQIAEGNFHPGPCNDYAIPIHIFYWEQQGATNPTGWWRWVVHTEEYSIESLESLELLRVSPFRMTMFTERYDCNSWRPRDPIVHWRDGTSNQIIIGEKHVPQRFLTRCAMNSDPINGAESRWTKSSDCNVFGASGTTFSDFYAATCRDVTAARAVFHLHRLARGPNDYENDPGGPVHAYAFGGIHPGVCQFAMGDGAVRSVSNTVNYQLIVWLTHVSDGNAVSLP